MGAAACRRRDLSRFSPNHRGDAACAAKPHAQDMFKNRADCCSCLRKMLRKNYCWALQGSRLRPWARIPSPVGKKMECLCRALARRALNARGTVSFSAQELVTRLCACGIPIAVSEDCPDAGAAPGLHAHRSAVSGVLHTTATVLPESNPMPLTAACEMKSAFLSDLWLSV